MDYAINIIEAKEELLNKNNQIEGENKSDEHMFSEPMKKLSTRFSAPDWKPSSFQKQTSNTIVTLERSYHPSTSNDNNNGYLMPIPQDKNLMILNSAKNFNQQNSNSNQISDSKSTISFGNTTNISKLGSFGNFSESTFNNNNKFHNIGAESVNGTAGARNHYSFLNQQSQEELQNFIKKMFSFYSFQKIFVALWLIIIYNSAQLTQIIKGSFYLFAIAVFIYMAILMMVQNKNDFIMKSPYSSICFLLFTISECFIVSFLLSTAHGTTVFLFAQYLTGIVLAITIFLNTNNISWFRGIAATLLMLIFMFILSISTLNQDYTDMTAILICMLGGLMFGIYLLTKAFQILNHRYSHDLTIDDYVIGSMTIYLDFGFVLLVIMFAMLLAIKEFSF
ncbi:UNKNOWN [Stylonychia lemnae]|uniref:Nmda receptor glutamate-binding chain n=1 Tax=Stylonychia lemnae TaxID=5949 RepID=A0A078ARR8_STYLE|nr:UNKNOWN [Stylonychia lemnae]|eukprot:CDW83882.1 UNKNOWN [Stylonychia lemnae]